jgi:hypothetical protein
MAKWFLSLSGKTMPYNIFISYSTKDFHIVESVRHALQNTPCNIFVAEYSVPAGAQLNQSILDAIKTCDLFILLWSHNSKSSEWVPQEIGAAKGLGKPILPIILDPSVNLPGFIRDLKYLPLQTDSSVAMQWLQQHIFQKVQSKEQTRALVLVGLVVLVLWALNQK